MRDSTVDGRPTAPIAGGTPEPRLLALYEPVLQFDPLEQFLPTKVQSFIPMRLSRS